jgi:hypothetical protein
MYLQFFGLTNTTLYMENPLAENIFVFTKIYCYTTQHYPDKKPKFRNTTKSINFLTTFGNEKRERERKSFRR